MYPRVKVRGQDDKIAVQEETTSYLLRVIESLSIEGKCDPSQLHANISKSDPKNSVSITPRKPQGKNSNDIDEDNTKNIRPSSVPRPRAVLSSPDNDEMIGNQNRLDRKKETVFERQNQKKHAQDNDEMIGNQNRLDRKKETVFERQNQKKHAQDAGRITGKQNQLIKKSETPLRNRPLGQNRNAQVKVSPANARFSAPPKTREIAIKSCVKTVVEEKPASDLSKLRPSIKRAEEKPASDLSKLRPSIKRGEEKPASDLSKLRPSIKRG